VTNLIIAYLDHHPKCLGEPVFLFSLRGREPPPAWQPNEDGFMESPCFGVHQKELVTHYSGPEGEMCCDRCAAFVRSMMGAGHGPREADWAPALRALVEAVGWEPKPWTEDALKEMGEKP
jgi:hypothetical protein